MLNGENVESYIGNTSSLPSFIQLMNRYEVMKDEEIEKLFLKLKDKNDKQTKEKIILANLKLVKTFAERIANQKNLQKKLEDLIQYGIIGLIKAVERFDITQGYKFSTYAVYYINSEINRSIDNNERIIRIPVSLMRQINILAKAKIELNNSLKREPTNAELANELNIPIEKVIELKAHDERLILKSLEAPLTTAKPEEDSGTLKDVVSNKESSKDFKNLEDKVLLEKAFKVLNEREKELVIKHFVYKKTYKELTLEYDLCTQRINAIIRNALAKMKIELEKKYDINKMIKRG